MVRVRLVVSGRVPGVWYRASTQAEARRLGLTGWVRNLLDGGVEVEAQGPVARVEALIAWCREGPGLARVLEVARSELAVVAGETGFEVQRTS